MDERVVLVRRWSGSPTSDWYPWLKKELEKENIEVIIPSMPHPNTPEIGAWVSFLREQIKDINEKTIFVGHSVGCQTILRYIESLPKGVRVGGIVLVAGWTRLTAEVMKEEEHANIAKPWLTTPIDWKSIKKHVKKVTAIVSDNDPYVPLNNADVFKNNLNAKVIIEREKGHFDDDTNTKKLQSAVDAVKDMLV